MKGVIGVINAGAGRKWLNERLNKEEENTILCLCRMEHAGYKSVCEVHWGREQDVYYMLCA